MSTPKSELHDDAVSLEQNASEHTLALNPLISLRSEDLASSAQLLTKAAIEQPLAVAKAWMTILGDMVEVARGKKIRDVESGGKRFKDPAWTNGAVQRAMLQGYLSWSNAMAQFVEESKLEPTDKARARLMAQIIVDAMSPSNTLLGNPAALKQFVDTGGESLLRGMKNFVTDLSENGGLPSMVDRSAFKVGKDIAATPGAVVFRNEMVELIQYNPTTPQVRQVPLVIAPPQINKYYALDLSPEKSLIRFALEGGFQTFCVSWRNPTPLHRHWGLEDYVQALDEAVDASRAITGTEQVSLMGSCSGGITASAYAGWLAARDEAKIANLILAVCVLDTATAPDIPGLGSFIAAETVEIAKQKSRSAGVLDGMEMAKVFAWMRPNDLIWNYWVNNYLLGNNPPAFDILFWNADTTRLPAQLHSDYLDMLTTNPFVISKNMAIKGSPVDMRKVKVNGYVIAGSTDHITPWKSVYRTARILGPETTFVLSNSGHLQSLLNPPSNPKASFAVGTADRKEADGFLAHAERRKESWWLHWRDWLYDRSGDIIEAPAELGSKEFRPDIPAPGSYVFE